MRCFVAVDLDPELRQPIEKLQDEIKDLDTKLVELYNLHFTLRFLGEVDEVAVNKVKIILADIASKYELFTINLENIGVFPDEKFIRVVWIGAELLYNLQADVDNHLSMFKTDQKPHLTIARVRSQTYRKELISFVDCHRSDRMGSMIVSQIKLKKSTVTSKGPIYEDIAIFELKK